MSGAICGRMSEIISSFREVAINTVSNGGMIVQRSPGSAVRSKETAIQQDSAKLSSYPVRESQTL